MNEEELLRLYLAQRAQTDPFAYTANEWGQGPSYMGLDEQPETWDRVGEVNDLLYDMTRTTGIDFAELVPGLHPFVAPPKPGDMETYQSDSSFLYGGNPVYQEIQRQVDSGLSLDQAINKIKTAYEQDPTKFEGLMPTVTSDNFNAGLRAGDPDWGQLTAGAQTFLTEARKEQNSQSEADRVRAAYEDYVRPRTAYEVAGAPEWSDARSQFSAMYGGFEKPSVEFQPQPGQRPPQGADRVPMDLTNVDGGGNLIPGLTAGFGVGKVNMTPDRITDLTRNPLAGRRRQQQEAQARADAEAIRNSPNRPMVGAIRGRGGENLPVGRSVVKRDFHEENVRRGFEEAMRQAKQKQVASKKEENLAKLIAAYNSFHYGQ